MKFKFGTGDECVVVLIALHVEDEQHCERFGVVVNEVQLPLRLLDIAYDERCEKP